MRTEYFRCAGIPARSWPLLAAIAALAAIPTQAQTLNRNLMVNSAGTLPSGSTTLTTPIQATVGGAPATVTYHRLSGFIGIYKIQLLVPAIPEHRRSGTEIHPGRSRGRPDPVHRP